MKPATTKNHSHHFYSDDEHSEGKIMSKDYLDFNEQVQDLDTKDEDIINDAHMMEVQELKNKLNNLENECKENVVKYELVINKLTKKNESLVNELMKERMKTRNNVETTHRKPVDAALGSKDKDMTNY